MQEPENTLSYFICEKNGFLVVTLNGVVTRSTSAQLERVKVDIAERKSKYIVLNCHGVTRLDQGGIPALVRVQQFIRSRSLQLRVCFLRSEYYVMLDEAGAIRSAEVLSNLIEALKSFPGGQKIAA